MKIIGIITILISISAFAIQPITLYHKNGKIAWNGYSVTHDNGTVAWNGISATYSNGKYAWNGINILHDNGSYAFTGTYANYENGKNAWNGSYAYYENGKIACNGYRAFNEEGKQVVTNLMNEASKVYLLDLELSEIKLSSKMTLLTKTLNQKTYVIGYKIQLSEKNSITINNESKTVENIVNSGNDIKFIVNNGRILVKVLDQKVFPR
jgi:hypothetical protein